MNKAVVAIGSNIEPQKNVAAARRAIAGAFSLLKESQFIYTKPVGYKKQPDFLNGAMLIKTYADRSEIVSTLKRIEDNLGRQRSGNKDGPRRIDLDLVVLNGQVLDDDVFKRKFLKHSIREVLPHFELV